MNRLLIIVIGTATVSASCSKGNDTAYTPDCSTAKSYAADVSTLIQSSCATNSGCHGTGSSRGPGALTTYQQIYNNRSAIRSSVANGSMPENSSLTPAQKNAILCWIDAGALNN